MTLWKVTTLFLVYLPTFDCSPCLLTIVNLNVLLTRQVIAVINNCLIVFTTNFYSSFINQCYFAFNWMVSFGVVDEWKHFYKRKVIFQRNELLQDQQDFSRRRFEVINKSVKVRRFMIFIVNYTLFIMTLFCSLIFINSLIPTAMKIPRLPTV